MVIKISSPGGGAASSERLYRETRRLREEKPVVMVMNGLVASGGYMMAMGVSHSYAQTSSLVGNVGVVSFSDPLIPPLPDESVLVSGPYKLSGFSRTEWFGTVEDLKEAFAQIVVSERGDSLRITQDELVQGRLYTGIQAVRLGLADELGGDSDAFSKAAEPGRDFQLRPGGGELGGAETVRQGLRGPIPARRQRGRPRRTRWHSWAGATPATTQPCNRKGIQTNSSMERLEALRGLILYGRLGTEQEDPLPDFPLELNHPNVYYLYVGNAR